MDGFRSSLYFPIVKSSGATGDVQTLCVNTNVGLDGQEDSTDDEETQIYNPHHTSSEEEDDRILLQATTWYENPDHVSKEEANGKQQRCIQNLLLHSLSVMLLNVPYMSLQHLKITVLTQAWGFSALLVSCLAAPLVVHYLGYKRTMLVGFAVHTLFVLSNIIPRINSVFPTFILVGLAGGPFWTAQGCYVSVLASEYCQYAQTDLRATTCAFFGLFFTFYHFSKILGRPLAYFVLDKKYIRKYLNSTSEDRGISSAASEENNSTTVSQCGRHYCFRSVEPELPEEAYDEGALRIFCMLYLLMCVLAFVIKLFFVDNKMPVSGVPVMTKWDLLRSTVYIHCKEMMIFILPLFLYLGFEHTFIYNNFLTAYVRCNLSYRSVGPIVFTLSLTETCATLVIGFFQKYPKCRVSLMEIGSLINIVLLGIARSTESQNWFEGHFYIFAIFWAVCDAIWQTSTSAMVSVLFAHCRSPAFATLRLWQSLAMAGGVSFSRYICMTPQLSVYVGLLVIATLCYTIMERRNKKRSAKAYIDLYTPVEPGNDQVTLYLQKFLSY